MSLEGSFSFINLADSENPFEAQGIPLVLNVPTTKYKATLTAKNQLVKNSFISFHGRHIPGYLFRAGRWNGMLEDRTVIDLTLGYEWKPQGVTFQVGLNNILDNKTPDVLARRLCAGSFPPQLHIALAALEIERCKVVA